MTIDANYPTMRETRLPLGPVRRGKVRDIYELDDKHLLIVTTDRISVYDRVLPDCVPHKGFGLNRTADYVFVETKGIVPNHMVDVPDENSMVVRRADTVYPVEVIVRGIITGSAWKTYQKGLPICGITLPPGLVKNQMLDEPIVTPTTKAEVGHDEPITHGQARELVGPHWDGIVEASLELFREGNRMAGERNAMLADTKFEYGAIDGRLTLLDEALTHDSSRWLETAEWEAALREGRDPDWIDKQFVRNYTVSVGFEGEGEPPSLPDNIRRGAAERIMKVLYFLSGNYPTEPEAPPSDERIMGNLKGSLWI